MLVKVLASILLAILAGWMTGPETVWFGHSADQCLFTDWSIVPRMR